MNSSTKKQSVRNSVKGCVMAAILLTAHVGWADDVCYDGCADPSPPGADCLSGCDLDLAGAGHFTIQADEVACVREGTVFSGGINMNGGELRVCGVAYPAYLNVNAGDVNILGSMSISNINMNNINSNLKNFGTLTVGNLNFQGPFENHGTAVVMYGLNVNWGALVYNSGDLSVDGYVNDMGLFMNRGILSVDGSVNLNNGEFSNSCETDISGDLNVSRNAINAGVLTVDGTITLNQELALGPDAQTQSSNLMLNAPVWGPTDDTCASFQVENTTIINGNSTITGNIDICDANGIEVNNGNLDDTVTTDCSCTPCESL